MVKDLSTLLRESAAHPPGDHGAASDLSEVVRLGRARVRRRRVVAAGGAVAAVAVIAVGGVVLTGAGPGEDRVAEPAEQLAPVGPVVDPADAGSGVEGRDFTELTTLTNDNLDRANGQYLLGTTPDGLVLVKDGPHGVDNASRWGLLDPATGTTEWLTEAPSFLERPIALEEDRLVFLGYDGDQPSVAIHDRDSGGWSVDTVLTAGAWDVFDAEMGPDNRVYFTRQGASSTQAQLWSASLDSPDAEPRDEGLTVGEFDITGDELVYTATHNEPNDRVTVRDLTTGEERSFDPRSGDSCNQLSMQRAGDHLVLGQYCGTTNGGKSPVRDDRVQVIDLDGNPVVTVQGHGVEPGTASDEGFVVSAYGSLGDRDGATYVWSFDEGELRRVADSVSKFWTEWLQSSALAWGEAVNDNHGARQVVARLP